jgi:hypothetical protein
MTPHFTRRASALRFFGFFLATLTVVVILVSVPQVTSAGQAAGRSSTPKPNAASIAPDTAPVRFSPTPYQVGGVYADSVAVADVNGDGKPDLIVAGSDGKVAVLLGGLYGSFGVDGVYDSGLGEAHSVAAGDVNGDGKPDIVLAGGSVAVLLGNGDGTFQPAVIFPAGSWAESVAIADVNGDGKPDLVVGDIYTCGYGSDPCAKGLVGVMLGNGDGSFQPLVANPSGGWRTYWVAVGDVNGDGMPDLVSGGCGSYICDAGVVGVLLGNGDGTFQPAVTYPISSIVLSVAIADLNGDAKPDLVVGADSSCEPACDSGSLDILLGNGDGTFQPEVAHSTGGFAGGVAVGDVNGDGEPDVVVAEECYGSACIPGVGLFLGNGDGTLQPLAVYDFPRSGKAASWVALGDFNGDGKLDIAVTMNYQEARLGGLVGVLLNLTKPQFTQTALSSSRSPSLVGQPVTFTATVSATYPTIPDGDLVTFLDANVILGSAPLAGGVASYTTSSLSAKPHIIKASYAGSANFKPSTRTFTQEVDKNATTTALVSSPNPSAYGQAVTFTATVASAGASTPTGRVTFTDGTTTIGSAAVSGGVASFKKPKLAVGSHSITVKYDGDAVSATSTSSAVIQVVN